MRKFFYGNIIALLLILSFVGCSNKEKLKQKETLLTQITTIPNQQEKIKTSKKQHNNISEEYESNKFDFSLVFPADWKDKYRIEEKDTSLIVYFKPKNQLNNNYSGELFCIVKKTNDLDESMFDSIDGKKYFKKNGITYLIGGPTDLTYPENGLEFDDFKKMQGEIPQIIKTLK